MLLLLLLLYIKVVVVEHRSRWISKLFLLLLNIKVVAVGNSNLLSGSIERVDLRLMRRDIIGKNLVFCDLDFDPLSVSTSPAGSARRRHGLVQGGVGALHPSVHLVQGVLKLPDAKQTVLQLVSTVAHRILQTRPSVRWVGRLRFLVCPPAVPAAAASREVNQPTLSSSRRTRLAPRKISQRCNVPVIDVVHGLDDHHRLVRVSVGRKQLCRVLIQRLDIHVLWINLSGWERWKRLICI